MKKLIPSSGYGTIQRAVMTLNIGPYAKLVYCLLMTYKGEKDACYPSISKISIDLQLSKSTILRAIKELENSKLVFVQRGKKKSGSNDVNKYIPDVIYTEIDIENPLGGGVCETPGGVCETPGVVSVRHHKNNIIKNNIEEEIESKDSISAKLFSDLPQPKKKKQFIPPTQAEVIEYFLANGYREDAAKKAFLYYDSADWKDSRGNQVKNWKQKMNGNWFRPENEGKKQNSSDQIKMVY